jgi:hypothetical protein
MNAPFAATAASSTVTDVQFRAIRDELVATRNFAAELRRRVVAQEVELERLRAELSEARSSSGPPLDMVALTGLQRAIRETARSLASRRVITGLTWRLLLGRGGDARRRVDLMLRDHGVPAELVPAASWIATPRAVLGLARRRAMVGQTPVEGMLVLELERDFAAQQRRLVDLRETKLPRSGGDGAGSGVGPDRAVRRFASAFAGGRMMMGLARRVMLGRFENVRQVVEALLLEHGVPPDRVPAMMWIAEPRVILGLARRRVVAGRLSIEGMVVLLLEREFGERI